MRSRDCYATRPTRRSTETWVPSADWTATADADFSEDGKRSSGPRQHPVYDLEVIAALDTSACA